MTEFNLVTKQCPVCHAKAVEKIDGRISFKPPSHHCIKCRAKLTAVHVKEALWAIPVAIIALGVMSALLSWLLDSQTIVGGFRAALMGGIAALAMSITFNVYMRGIVFRHWKG